MPGNSTVETARQNGAGKERCRPSKRLEYRAGSNQTLKTQDLPVQNEGRVPAAEPTWEFTAPSATASNHNSPPGKTSLTALI